MPTMLDLFAGRLGWSKAFLARGWKVIAVDLVEPPEIPDGVDFYQKDVMDLHPWYFIGVDFICASSPCEEFSVWGMKHFHPNPDYPANGIMLFEHTRSRCEASGVPYVMENVRPAQKFVGPAVNHAGPFYLWGNAVPPLIVQGFKKGIDWGSSKDINRCKTQEEKRAYRDKPYFYNRAYSNSLKRKEDIARGCNHSARASKLRG